jgi:integrase
MFHKLIDESLGRSRQIKLSFYEYFQDFINRTAAGQRITVKGVIISPTKAKMYGTTYNKLKDFNPRLDFDGIDLDFYNDFTAWLRKKGFAENNVGGHIQRVKAVLNEATEKGVNTNLAFRSKRFITVSEEVDNIALTEKELKDILTLDLSAKPGHERVRDLFIVGCHTGLRFGDGGHLTADNIKGGFIEVRQAKTGDPVAIPIHPVVKTIIAKYNGNLPAAISNQKTNEYLKEICQQVECLQQPASKTRTKGGVKVTVSYERWQIVSSHTARRSFATNAYLQGIPTVTIMAITGHKTEKSFLKYIKVTPREHAKIMAAHWANRSKLKVAK